MEPADASALDAACRALGLRLVVRFGSRACRRDRPPTPDSDLDLAVLAGDRHVRLGDAWIALAPLFPGVSLDLALVNGADPLFRHEIFRRGGLV